MLRRIDEDALPAFLETSAPDNLGYYERFGFLVTAESTLPNGIPLWGMRRQPSLRLGQMGGRTQAPDPRKARSSGKASEPA